LPNDTGRSNPSSPDSEFARLQQAVADLQTRVSALERGAPAPARPEGPRFGLTAINRVGAVTLAVGVIFFFKYASDNQWIGAESLVLLGILMALLLVGLAEWLRRRSDDAFAQGVAGCGFAILYISIYASFGYYKLVSRELGFAGLLVSSALALAFSFRFASAAIAAVGVIGVWVAPLLVRSESSVFLFVLSPLSAWVTERLSRRAPQQPALALLPFNAAWALLTAWILLAPAHSVELACFAFSTSAAYFILAALNRTRATFYNALYFVAHAYVVVGALRLIVLWASNNIAAIDRENFISAATSILLGLYGVACLCYGFLRKSATDRMLALGLLGIVIAKLYLYDVWLLTRFYRISALVILGVLLLGASYLYSRFKQRGSVSR